MTLHSEILEQPDRLADLYSKQRAAVEEIAQAIHKRGIRYVFLAARGTSDNAGRYANYLWGAMNGLPMALATPSLFTYYNQPPRLKDALVVGVSQSGVSPDIVSVLEEGKRQGCLTLAITNEMESPLVQAADFVVDLHTGPELAVAATKTYTAELMAIAMLSAALDDSAARWKELGQVPAWAEMVIKPQAGIAPLVERYRFMSQCVVLGRGFNYATTFEWALKIKELTYVAAEPYSSADFRHGPIAIVDRGFPVLAIAMAGKVFDSLFGLLQTLRSRQAAELVVISNAQSALQLAQTSIAIPGDLPEWLTPLVSIIPAQLFCYYLALAKGYDPDKPRHIHKITETR